MIPDDFRFSMRNPVLFNEFSDFGHAGGRAQIDSSRRFFPDEARKLIWNLLIGNFPTGLIHKVSSRGKPEYLCETFFLKSFFRKFGPGLRSVVEILIKTLFLAHPVYIDVFIKGNLDMHAIHKDSQYVHRFLKSILYSHGLCKEMLYVCVKI